jgi:hypothetical protein
LEAALVALVEAGKALDPAACLVELVASAEGPAVAVELHQQAIQLMLLGGRKESLHIHVWGFIHANIVNIDLAAVGHLFDFAAFLKPSVIRWRMYASVSSCDGKPWPLTPKARS